MQSSSLALRACATFVYVLSCLIFAVSAATTTTSASYALQTTYAGASFFNTFDFFTDADPTHGFVTYVNQSTAQSQGLISASDGSPVIIGVDHTNTYDGTVAYSGINGVGRPSVRITSQQKFNHGLIIADIANMPGGVCGAWPALWTLGDGTWPYHGEIDIIEGVNQMTGDLSSMHTAGHCIAPGSSASESGTVQTTNCTYDVNTGDNSAGCGVLDTNTQSFGLGFNSNGGGVYAMEWTSAYIRVYFFPRGSIPSDITNGTPKPSGWGTPAVDFEGDCSIDSNFINHQIVLDTTFCGDWAGSVWTDTCSSSTGVSSCSVYVGNNPSAFNNMYWAINSIKVYSTAVSSSSSSTTSTTSTTLATSTSSTSTSTTTSTTTTATTTTSTVPSSTSTTTSTTSTTLSTSTTTSTTATTTSTTTTTTAPKTSTTTTTKKSSTTTTTTKKPTTTTTTTKKTSTTTKKSSTTTSTTKKSTTTTASATKKAKRGTHGLQHERLHRPRQHMVHAHEH